MHANEVLVADGYGNRRVIVFDAATGAYKRHWGAYGNKPDDKAPNARQATGPGVQQFNTPHGITVSKDGVVYVSDRAHNRVQSFRLDGTFLKEGFVKMSPYGAAVPAEARAKGDAVKQQMVAGNYVIFKGPIKDNKGNSVIAAGTSLTQTDPVLESMNYLVEGVVGSTS